MVDESAEKKGSERDRRRDCLSFQGQWDNHSYPFHLSVSFLCHSLSVGNIVLMCNMSIFLCYTIYTVVHHGLLNISSQCSHLAICILLELEITKQLNSASDLHWNTSFTFWCCTVHVVHSYTDVREQKTLPSAAAALSLGPHRNSFLAWGSSWEGVKKKYIYCKRNI